MEFAGIRGEQERGVDVWLGDEMTEVRGYDVISFPFFVRGFCDLIERLGLLALIIRVWLFGFPLFEDRLELFFCTEKSNPLPSITHPGLQDPPLPLIWFPSLILLETGL